MAHMRDTVLTVGIALVLSGCATILSGEPVQVSVNSEPAGAKFQYGPFTGRTPSTIFVPRKALTQSATFSLDGYEDKTVPVTTSTQGIVWLGIFFWPSIVIDFITGNASDLNPPLITAILSSNSGGVSIGRPKLKMETDSVLASDVDVVPAIPTSRQHAYAIVIGIEEYQQKLPKADYAAHDAEIMGQYLTKALGYQEENVVVLLNERATKTSMEKYVEGWLVDRVEKGDSVFIYYSGHGAPNPKTGKAFLVPYDGDPAFVEQTGYPLERLYERLSALPAKEVVVMLDSCFSGAGGRSVIAKGMRPMVLSVENPLLIKGRTTVLTAGAGDQVSSTYDQKSHGLLTYFFLKGLQGEADQNNDKRIELRELFEYLKPQVERTARREFHNEQTPQLIGSPDTLKKGVVLIGKE